MNFEKFERNKFCEVHSIYGSGPPKNEQILKMRLYGIKYLVRFRWGLDKIFIRWKRYH